MNALQLPLVRKLTKEEGKMRKQMPYAVHAQRASPMPRFPSPLDPNQKFISTLSFLTKSRVNGRMFTLQLILHTMKFVQVLVLI